MAHWIRGQRRESDLAPNILSVHTGDVCPSTKRAESPLNLSNPTSTYYGHFAGEPHRQEQIWMEIIVNLALWIIAGVLAFAFAASGMMKVIQSKEKVVASGTGAWAADWSPASIKFIGVAEILGAIGLILPALLHVAPILVPLAALGLIGVMIGAAIVHSRRHEAPNVAVNVVVIVLAAIVVWGRFGPYAFGA